MWQETIKPFFFSYWQTLYRLRQGKKELHKILDLPLKDATARAFSTMVWTVAFFMTAMISVHSSPLIKFISHLKLWSIAVLPFLYILTILLAYGCFRLYVLISHVIAINIFKSRGQRLRWMNQLTAILTLGFPATLAFVLFQQTRFIGSALGIVIGIYSLFLGTWACKLVFHKTTWRGLGFSLGLHAVTIFVLVTCLIAALAAIFIIGFFILAIARFFYT